MISQTTSDIITPIIISQTVVSYVISYVISYENTTSFCCLLSGCCLPAVFLCLLCCPGHCLAHLLPPDSLCLLNRHCLGLVQSVVPQPEIHLVKSAAIPAILLGICRLCSKASAQEEFVGNSWVGVAVDKAGDEGGLSQYIDHILAAGQMYRHGKHWLLALSNNMGTCLCMTLFRVRLMGSNVLKYTRDTSLWPVSVAVLPESDPDCKE